MGEFLKNHHLFIATVTKVSKNNFIKLEAQFLKLDKKYNKFWKRRETLWSSVTPKPYQVGDVVLVEKYKKWKHPLPPSSISRLVFENNGAKDSGNQNLPLLKSGDIIGEFPPTRPSWLKRILTPSDKVTSRGKEWIIVGLVEPSMDIISGENNNPYLHFQQYKELVSTSNK